MERLSHNIPKLASKPLNWAAETINHAEKHEIALSFSGVLLLGALFTQSEPALVAFCVNTAEMCRQTLINRPPDPN